MPMPTKDEILLENPTLHADLALGYDDAQRITILNSWGRSFGNDEYFQMPYEYILNKTRAYFFLMVRAWIMIPLEYYGLSSSFCKHLLLLWYLRNTVGTLNL